MSVHIVDPSHLFANALAAHALAEIESETHNQNSRFVTLGGNIKSTYIGEGNREKVKG